MRLPSLRRNRRALKLARPRGQAMTETVLLTVLLFGWGFTMMYFFPDSFNALQIYMDNFYFMLSLPIP